MKGPIKPTITHVGQQYVDDPVYVHPKRKSEIEMAVQSALNPRMAQPSPVRVRFDRVRLEWMDPSTTT